MVGAGAKVLALGVHPAPFFKDPGLTCALKGLSWLLRGKLSLGCVQQEWKLANKLGDDGNNPVKMMLAQIRGVMELAEAFRFWIYLESRAGGIFREGGWRRRRIQSSPGDILHWRCLVDLHVLPHGHLQGWSSGQSWDTKAAEEMPKALAGFQGSTWLGQACVVLVLGRRVTDMNTQPQFAFSLDNLWQSVLDVNLAV